MAEYQLHCFGESGNSYRVALMLELTGSDWEPVFVDYFNGETRGPGYREMSVMGEAPVLTRGDLHLTQSGVILDYLADETARFGGATPEEKREIWRWILFDNHKLSSFTALRRFLLTLTKAGDSPVTEFLAQRMDGAWSVLDAHLKDRAFVVAERPTIADLSLCGYLFYGDELVWPLERYPAISAWLERIRALPGWKPPYELMPRALPVAAR
ncbi:glutathione S-transferase family protein [Hansschlegelia sp. KR7-227]|uniref:glutathione S-transferase family protein n=1 Tax=Hansschlegelia sp. KR7-227 TaxID=3400914 RepID=UPI003BFA8013